MRTGGSYSWRIMYISLSFGLPVPNTPLFQLTACRKSISTTHMVANGKNTISGEGGGEYQNFAT